MSVLKIKPADLKLGYAVKLPGGWLKHPFLSGNMIIENMQQLQIIRSLDLEYVFFYPDKSKKIDMPAELNDEDSASFNMAASEAQIKMQQDKMARIEKAKAHRRDIQKTEKAFAQSLVQVKNLMSKLGSRPLNAIDEATGLIGAMADVLLSSDSLVLHLISNANKEQEGMYYHVLNVSTLSMMLAKNLNLSAEQIKLVGLGALFHDIGKVKIPSQIIRKTTPLTTPEENLLKLHTKYGADLVKLVETYPIEAYAIIEQHHEYIDGSGYPNGLKGNAIDPLAKIVAVVNEFDNLCHPRDMSKARSPHQALAHLYRAMKGRLEEREMKVMIKMMGVYPPGTIVLLSDQRLGIVMSVNSENLLCPNVMVYDADVPRLEAPIITLVPDKLNISKVIKIQALPQHIAEYLNPRAQVSYHIQGST
ncbi:HD-GYP domain-containing protein [Rheinheimera baltica]|uniref:HD-GYP domain-containing protein n=1 Tax=Rheinheimera baltica TaxID=67576 RepID=A0ABT9HUB2_9GAMM|nr:HD-GYP domain-containing protein [Rheinheimera baltica]MDP5134714.1 HD-GYP domain-containing protein [Rheinheimera baltica]MDP5141531.1 HD-GYP domain-containing protein [Rheinheimera baltica]MDP5148767.1 HD-GYP domain-containing protein [Rheinheimera baltica]MDP5191465.1 HD-GYP domain-containing protein [Rheinheimera baltica]